MLVVVNTLPRWAPGFKSRHLHHFSSTKGAPLPGCRRGASLDRVFARPAGLVAIAERDPKSPPRTGYPNDKTPAQNRILIPRNWTGGSFRGRPGGNSLRMACAVARPGCRVSGVVHRHRHFLAILGE